MAAAHGTDRLAVKGACEALGFARVLDQPLRALGDKGQEGFACRLAAQAWALVEPARPAEARPVNGTLHYLCRPPASEPPAGGATPGREACEVG